MNFSYSNDVFSFIDLNCPVVKFLVFPMLLAGLAALIEYFSKPRIRKGKEELEYRVWIKETHAGGATSDEIRPNKSLDDVKIMINSNNPSEQVISIDTLAKPLSKTNYSELSSIGVDLLTLALAVDFIYQSRLIWFLAFMHLVVGVIIAHWLKNMNDISPKEIDKRNNSTISIIFLGFLTLLSAFILGGIK